MKKIITSDSGGHPVKYLDFEFMQEIINELTSCQFKDLPQNKVVVLSGVQIVTDGSNLTVTEGYVYSYGEIWHVPGTEIVKEVGTNVAVWMRRDSYDSRGSKTFNDGSIHQVYYVREMIPAYVDPVTLNFGLISDTTHFSQYSGGAPIGLISMWSGTNIPAGWALCDGSIVNGITTPDLRGRMIISANSADPDYANSGNLSEGGETAGASGNGGGKKSTFTLADMPKHRHAKGSIGVVAFGGVHSHAIAFEKGNADGGSGSSNVQATYKNYLDPSADIFGSTVQINGTDYHRGAHNHTISGETADAGGSATSIEKDVRHPWYTLAFIMRVG